MSGVIFDDNVNPEPPGVPWEGGDGDSPEQSATIITIGQTDYNLWYFGSPLVEMFKPYEEIYPCTYAFLRFYGGIGHELFKRFAVTPDNAALRRKYEMNMNAAFAYLVYNYFMHFELPWMHTLLSSSQGSSTKFPTLTSPLLVRRKLGYSSKSIVSPAEVALQAINAGENYINTIPMSTTYCIHRNEEPVDDGVYLHIGLDIGCPIVAYGGLNAEDDDDVGRGECEILLPRNCQFQVYSNTFNEQTQVRIISMKLVAYNAQNDDLNNRLIKNAYKVIPSLVEPLRAVEHRSMAYVLGGLGHIINPGECFELMDMDTAAELLLDTAAEKPGGMLADNKFATMMFTTYAISKHSDALERGGPFYFFQAAKYEEFTDDHATMQFVNRFLHVHELPKIPDDTEFFPTAEGSRKMTLFSLHTDRGLNIPAGTRCVVLPAGEYLLLP
jgi:hypothetical protein